MVVVLVAYGWADRRNGAVARAHFSTDPTRADGRSLDWDLIADPNSQTKPRNMPIPATASRSRKAITSLKIARGENEPLRSHFGGMALYTVQLMAHNAPYCAGRPRGGRVVAPTRRCRLRDVARRGWYVASTPTQQHPTLVRHSVT